LEEPTFPQAQGAAVKIERRATVRYYLLPNPPVRFLARPGFQFGTALLRDVSATGLCLALEQYLEAGTRLVVQLPGRRRGSSLSRTAVVLRVQALDDGRWLAGCQLNPRLSDHEMRELRLDGQAGEAPAPACPDKLDEST
jgi:hypothetical protein